MTPLKVTCWLDAPLAGDAPCLAALLEWAMAAKMRSVMATDRNRRHQVEPRLRGEEVSEPGKVPIPIERRMLGRFPVPLCSAPILPQPWHESSEFINKKLATECAELLRPEERKVVSTTGGLYKSYRLPLRIRCVDRIVWFVQGRRHGASERAPTAGAAIRKLLKEVIAVGKKTADGYGRVLRWEVEHFAHDWHWFAPSENGPVLMRPLPLGPWLPTGLVGAKRWFGSPVPPYWQRSLYAEIVQPC